MTVCALILAHQKPKLLGRLVGRLHRAGIRSIIHVDAKIDQLPFEQACADSEAIFIPARTEVFWGGYTMVEATAALARAGLEDPAHTHFYHISGDTYPILSDNDLMDSLTQDLDFIDTHEAKPGTTAYKRIANTYLPDSRIGALRQGMLHEERYVTGNVVDVFADIARVHAIKTAAPFPWRYAKGANWWGFRRASLETCLQILATKTDFVDWFRYSSNPDESFFNTIALNFLDPAKCRPSPVYSVWNTVPAPYEFRSIDDMQHLNKTKCAFARKFSPEATDLLDFLDAQEPVHTIAEVPWQRQMEAST